MGCTNTKYRSQEQKGRPTKSEGAVCLCVCMWQVNEKVSFYGHQEKAKKLIKQASNEDDMQVVNKK